MTNMTGGTADCFRCEDEEKAAKAAAGAPFLELIYRDFIVCNTCGNKRCPQATDHRLECTGSNEPGQAGSAYGGIGIGFTLG